MTRQKSSIAVDATSESGMAAAVDVEAFGLRLEGGALVARMARTALIGDPDACAASVIGLDPASSPDTVLHSTSWRWIGGRVVLTYLCCPDPLPSLHGASVRPASDHPAAIDPARPGASAASPQQVLHHGIDHLAWLADHHPLLIEQSRSAHPRLWNQLMRAGRHRAGQLPHH